MKRCLLLIAALPLCSAFGEDVSFNREIRPILSDHCFRCHGADAGSRKAGLRLDTHAGAVEDRDGIRAVVPGDPSRSALWERITSEDPDEIMPPPESHKTLSDAQKETLRRWIEAGAAYETHWAFVPIAPSRLPELRRSGWARNGIDFYVLAELERRSLAPSPEADRETLIRRVTLDLTGLPPTPEEVEAFLRDPSDAAYEGLVDRLLRSPHFGEHLAVSWLDAARYADTNGYFGDKPRLMWLWRDWVIAAFNENVPYDRFTIEQLAGDLLPGASVNQRIATAFNRNHIANNESGIIAEEFRVEYVVDRVDTTMTTWLGITAGCAQCHDHKFDPVSQREFYGLFAFFNNVPEEGLIKADNPPPLISVPTPEQERQLAACVAETKEARAAFEPVRKRLTAELAVWERGAADELPNPPREAVFHEPFDGGPAAGTVIVGNPPTFERGVRGEAVKFDATQHAEATVAAFDPDKPWTMGLWYKAEGSLSCLLSLIEAEGDRRGLEMIWQKGRIQVNLVHRWGSSAIEVSTLDAVGTGQWHHLAVTYDGSRRAEGLRLFIDGVVSPLETRSDHLEGTLRNDEVLRIGRRDSGLGFYGLIDGVRLVQEEMDAESIRAWQRGERIRGILETTPAERSSGDAGILFDDYLHHHGDPAAREAGERVQLANRAEKALRDSIPTVLVMEEMEKPRPTYVLERGLYDQPGEVVSPHVPTAIAPWPEGAPTNRLGFAQWLVSERNPLTARVAVNRLWAHGFGEGLVRTPDDFGSQGEAPTHPELLDHLAVTFRESGWDVKALLKEIVSSATYRQSSVIRPDLSDPANRLLARGPSGRLSGEMLRDQALAVSGLLVPKIGGPSVKPYQPPGLWEAVSYNAEERYLADTGEGLFRRSLYTYVKRQAPPPFLLTFDGPTREKCSVRRTVTNTPLQALQLLNDDTFVEASRVLAGRILGQSGDDATRLRRLWKQVLARDPEATEIAAMDGLLRRQRTRFLENGPAAAELLSVGAAPRVTKLAPAEHAAWSVVALTVLNLDETLTKP